MIVLVTLLNSSLILNLSKNIENLCKRFKHYKLYDIDISSEQSFLYEKDIYPLGLYNILETSKDPLHFSLCLTNDNIISFDYTIPDFKFLSFDIISERKTIVNTLKDKVSANRS